MDIKPDQFEIALNNAIMTSPAALYEKTIEEIYQGLWERTSEQLRVDVKALTKDDIPSHMSEIALIYTRLAGMFARDLLRKYQVVDEELGMRVVFGAAKMIHEQAMATANFLGEDLITGKRFLPKSNE